jgi:predicted  nucleic acid-binding Zn-ribbon protein
MNQPSAADSDLSPKTLDLDYFESPTKLFKCIEDQAWDVAIRRLERMPQEARSWIVRRAFDGSIVWRRLPIHEALIHSAPSKVIEALLNAYPDSAKEVGDTSKRLAIHYACEHRASHDVIKILLQLYPNGAKEIESNNRLAIHYACEYNAPNDVIKLLLIANPTCLNEKDDWGNTPGTYLNHIKELNGSQNLSIEEKAQSSSLIPSSHEHKSKDDPTSIMVTVLKEELINVQQSLTFTQNKEEALSKQNQLLTTKINELLLTKMELECKLIENIANASETEKRMLKDKEIALSQIKDEHQQEISMMQEYRRQMLGDLNVEFNAYKESKGFQISSLESEKTALAYELKAKESEITNLQNELGNMNTEVQLQSNRANEANKRAENLSIKLKEAVDAIQNATNSILEERQSCAELEQEIDIAVKSLDQLKLYNIMLEEEVQAKGLALNTAEQDIAKLSEEMECVQRELTDKITEYDNVKKSADDYYLQLNEAVEKCENAVSVITGQRTSIRNLADDLKEKEENITRLEQELYDLKLMHHSKTDDLYRQVHDSIEKFENADNVIKEQKKSIDNLTSDLKEKEECITRLEEELCDLKLKHHAVKENSAVLAKTMKLINLCLLSSDSVEERLDENTRFHIIEKLARHQLLDESMMNENRSNGMNSPSNKKEKVVGQRIPSDYPSCDDGRYNNYEEYVRSKNAGYNGRGSPNSSPHARSLSKSLHPTVNRHDALMSLSHMIQDLVNDRRVSLDVEQARFTYPTYD